MSRSAKLILPLSHVDAQIWRSFCELGRNLTIRAVRRTVCESTFLVLLCVHAWAIRVSGWQSLLQIRQFYDDALMLVFDWSMLDSWYVAGTSLLVSNVTASCKRSFSRIEFSTGVWCLSDYCLSSSRIRFNGKSRRVRRIFIAADLHAFIFRRHFVVHEMSHSFYDTAIDIACQNLLSTHPTLVSSKFLITAVQLVSNQKRWRPPKQHSDSQDGNEWAQK